MAKKVVREIIMDAAGNPIGATVKFPTIGKAVTVFPEDFGGEGETEAFGALSFVNRMMWINGAKQKFGDKTAEYTRENRMQEAFEALTALKEHMSTEGEWEMRGGGGGYATLIEAYARVKGISMDDASAEWNEKCQKEDPKAIAAKLRKHPKIVVAEAEIKLERAKAGMSDDDEADDLLM